MKKIKAILLVLLMMISVVFIGESTSSAGPLAAHAQKRVVRKTYRGGKRVTKRTWKSSKRVSRKGWARTHPARRKTWRTGRKVVSRTKKILTP